jgi:hypothetical protein
MVRIMNFIKQMAYGVGIVALAFVFILFGASGPAQAQLTIPVMVDYFDTATPGATTPDGVTYIPPSGNFAMVDDVQDKVIIVDSDGFFVSEFDTTPFGSTAASGITYITSGPRAGNFAIIDDIQDEVYIVNGTGVLQDQFDTAKFNAFSPQGIAFISSGAFSGDLALVNSANPDEVLR